jgi:SAM-dependent methyltransferase
MPPESADFSYDEIADAYARGVDDAPYNALYERPAMLAMLPPLAGRRVLDAGCGSGWYAEQLLAGGAAVVGIDASAAMIDRARARLGARAELHVVSLGHPLPFGDGRFDVVVSPLVLHYLRDWGPALDELRRVLAEGGTFLFSTHHPWHEAERLEATGFEVRYGEVQVVEEEWPRVGRVRFFRRSLGAIVDALADAGFVVERLVEPTPTEAFRALKPEAYERLMRRPAFLLVRARSRARG